MSGTFFAISLGKSACDGIGGVVKKMIAKARLQRPFENQIFTVQDMYTFCKQNFGEKISFLYSGEEIEKEKFLATRFQNALLIPGTQKLHKIIPVGNVRVKIYKTSNADEGEEKITQKNSKKDVVQAGMWKRLFFKRFRFHTYRFRFRFHQQKTEKRPLTIF